MRSDKYINKTIKVGDTSNKESITTTCESIMLRELSVIHNGTNSGEMVQASCNILEAVSAAYMAVNV